MAHMLRAERKERLRRRQAKRWQESRARAQAEKIPSGVRESKKSACSCVNARRCALRVRARVTPQYERARGSARGAQTRKRRARAMRAMRDRECYALRRKRRQAAACASSANAWRSAQPWRYARARARRAGRTQERKIKENATICARHARARRALCA